MNSDFLKQASYRKRVVVMEPLHGRKTAGLDHHKTSDILRIVAGHKWTRLDQLRDPGSQVLPMRAAV
jgi:hypothetical protein